MTAAPLLSLLYNKKIKKHDYLDIDINGNCGQFMGCSERCNRYHWFNY